MTNKRFLQSIQNIFPKNLPNKIAVAVSGGSDSMALLVLLKNLFDKKTEIFCVTIDHNFRKNSDRDALFVEKFCQKNQINCTILKSYLENPPEVDIEGSLREVRYNLLQEFCKKNQIENLFIAHHQNDLAENFLIRLFRGSGIDGLAAMNSVYNRDESFCDTTINYKINIIRPLLNFSKSELKKYLQSKNITWVEDETNEDEKYLRNKIRNFLKTLPDSETINGRIALASQAILSAKIILEKETKKQFPKIFQKDSKGLILDVVKFRKLEQETATRYLGLALMKVSTQFYKPRLKKLLGLYQTILENKFPKKISKKTPNKIPGQIEFYGCFLSLIDEDKILISKKFQ